MKLRVSAPTQIKGGLLKEILLSSMLTGLIHITDEISLSLEAETGQRYVCLKAGCTRSKPLFVYLYMDLLSFTTVQAYSHSEGSQRAISICSDIFTLCLKECDVLCT